MSGIITSEIIRIICKDPIPFTRTVQITGSYASKHVKRYTSRNGSGGTGNRNGNGTRIEELLLEIRHVLMAHKGRGGRGASLSHKDRPFRTHFCEYLLALEIQRVV